MLYSSPGSIYPQASVPCDGKSAKQPQNDLTDFCILNTNPSCSKHNVILLEPNSTDIPG